MDNFLKTLSSLPPEEALEHLKVIGHTLGAFHSLDAKLEYNGYGQAILYGWVHGDFISHLGNIFYDPKTKIVTFIDYEGMKKIKGSNSEISNFFTWAGEAISGYQKGVGYSSQDANAEKFMRALLKSYLSAFSGGPLKVVAAKDAWNGTDAYFQKRTGTSLSNLDMAEKSQVEKAWNQLEDLTKIRPVYKQGTMIIEERVRSQLSPVIQVLDSKVDLSKLLWNQIDDEGSLLGAIYEIVDGEKTYWVRKSLDKNDVYKTWKKATGKSTKKTFLRYHPGSFPKIFFFPFLIQKGSLKNG